MFTPLLMLSFDADLRAFGLRPEAFYPTSSSRSPPPRPRSSPCSGCGCHGRSRFSPRCFSWGCPDDRLGAGAARPPLRGGADPRRLRDAPVRPLPWSRGRRALAWGSGAPLPRSDAREGGLRAAGRGPPRAAGGRAAERTATAAAPRRSAGRGAHSRADNAASARSAEATPGRSSPEELPRAGRGPPGEGRRQFVGGNPAWDALLLAALALGIAAALRDGGRRAAGLLVAALALSVAPIAPVSKAFQPRYAGARVADGRRRLCVRLRRARRGPAVPAPAAPGSRSPPPRASPPRRSTCGAGRRRTPPPGA